MGLPISVYRDADGSDCTNNGVSSRFSRLLLVNAAGPFGLRDRECPVLMQSHVPGCLRIVPAIEKDGQWVEAPGWWMMGGNYAATSDSRFGELAQKLLTEGYKKAGIKNGRVNWYGAVAIHDRQE